MRAHKAAVDTCICPSWTLFGEFNRTLLKNRLFELIHQGKLAWGYGRHLSRLASSRKFRAISLSGVLPGTETAIKVLYLGHAGNIVPIHEFFFDGHAQSIDLGPVHALFQRRARSRFCSPDTDAVVTARLPRISRPGPGVYQTTSLYAVLPLPATMEEYLATLSETERRKLRQAQKAGFDTELGETQSDYREFLERMFVPLMRHRHGQKAFIAPIEQLYGQAHRSSLIFIKSEGKRVGGILLRWPRINGTHALPHFDKIGIIDEVSRDAAQLNRVNIALYYQMFNATIQRGYRRISLGVVQPLLNNGLLWFKARWGADFFPGSQEFDFYSHDIEFCSKKRHEIQCHRYMVHIEEDGLVATVGVNDNEAQTPALESKLKGWRFPNLRRIYLTYPDGHVDVRTNKAGDKAPAK
jgi:hypothetical protein